MAIYQFYLAAIPKKGIIEHFEEIPTRLEVDFQKQTESFLNEKAKDKFDYFEFIQHKCWEIANIDSGEIVNQIDKKLDRAVWGNDKECNNWKIETNLIDNDSWILIRPEESQVKEFAFRADLREPKLKFLIEMIELAKEWELLLMDRKGNIVEPQFRKVIELIKESNASRFIEYPNKFLTDLEKSEIEVD